MARCAPHKAPYRRVARRERAKISQKSRRFHSSSSELGFAASAFDAETHAEDLPPFGDIMVSRLLAFAAPAPRSVPQERFRISSAPTSRLSNSFQDFPTTCAGLTSSVFDKRNGAFPVAFEIPVAHCVQNARIRFAVPVITQMFTAWILQIVRRVEELMQDGEADNILRQAFATRSRGVPG